MKKRKSVKKLKKELLVKKKTKQDVKIIRGILEIAIILLFLIEVSIR